MDFVEKQVQDNIITDIDGECIELSDDSTNNNNSENKVVTEFEPKPFFLYNDVDTILKRKHSLTHDIKNRGPSCSLIIVDNFYNNPMETRNYILTQPFTVKGNFPGQRTRSFANEHLKEVIQRYVLPYGGKITDFPIPKEDGSDAYTIYNGAYQYTTSRDRSWIHTDKHNNWGGIVFMTPDAPLTSGTGFFKFYDGSVSEKDSILLNNKDEINDASQDLTKWDKTDTVANIFNRLILFNATNYHMSLDYFGTTKENSRLFQTFFFSTER